MSTQLTNPTQSSHLADEQTNTLTLPPPEHLAEGSEICQDVCNNSCIQSHGRCTGKLNKVAAHEHAQLKNGEGYDSLISPLIRAARATCLGENTSNYDQFNATDAFNRTARSLHHIRSYGDTLEKGKRSAALTDWVEGYEELYGGMHQKAIDHAPSATKDRATVELLGNQEALASEYGHRDTAAEFGKHAAEIESELEDNATKFAETYTVAFWDHFKKLPSAYNQKTPPRAQVRRWNPSMSQEASQGDRTTRPPNVSQGDGHTRGSQVRGEAKIKRRLGISRANPNRDDSGTDP